ncbi:hypothetical protein CCR95_18440 [Thiocystis minor]|uniref:DUF1810 family protein n=1 Tax=Thiocystis minor TaxID=61597 RepID=UPI00191420E6|nr:DUF1810 family protein [Thiocystis minor]MBK5966001.1 hypothetical protein [Thiocystis minor]
MTIHRSFQTELERFVQAQSGVYERALAEIRGGRKTSHWMWFIFPQLLGLGQSENSRRFGIHGLDEARAYLNHPLLGPRLVECAEDAIAIQGRTAAEIFGHPDDRKLRSSATLFALASPSTDVFQRVLDRFFDGVQDDRTLHRLSLDEPSAPMTTNTQKATHSKEAPMTASTWTRIIVIDFEATCDEPHNPVPQEIIEFPAVVVNVPDRSVMHEFHRYVRPVAHPRLTAFCTGLTGIGQATIDSADDFPTVFRDFQQWIGANGLEDAPIATCGNWDLDTLMPAQCHQHGLPLPAWARSWINVKKVFARCFPQAQFKGLAGMLDHLGLTFEGRPHSGIDDARNIARVLIALLAHDAGCLQTALETPITLEQDGTPSERIAKLIQQLTPDCGKSQAQDIEFAILDLAKLDPNAILSFASLPAPPQRECIAFVAGMLIKKRLGTDRIREMLQDLAHDENNWVRRKAERALGGRH